MGLPEALEDKNDDDCWGESALLDRMPPAGEGEFLLMDRADVDNDDDANDNKEGPKELVGTGEGECLVECVLLSFFFGASETMYTSLFSSWRWASKYSTAVARMLLLFIDGKDEEDEDDDDDDEEEEEDDDDCVEAVEPL